MTNVVSDKIIDDHLFVNTKSIQDILIFESTDDVNKITFLENSDHRAEMCLCEIFDLIGMPSTAA